MKYLLVAVDFSDATMPVLEAAKRLAQALGASLRLLHVAEPVSSYVPLSASLDVLAAGLPPAAPGQEAAARRLETLAQEARRWGAEVTCDAVTGDPVEEIIERSAAPECELVVMGSHGQGALYHLLEGSVVNGVLKRARRPICVVPAGVWRHK